MRAIHETSQGGAMKRTGSWDKLTAARMRATDSARMPVRAQLVQRTAAGIRALVGGAGASQLRSSLHALSSWGRRPAQVR